MSEEHDNKVCQSNYEQLPNRWNNSWPHIRLAHETHEVHETKSAKQSDERHSVDLRLKFFASFRVFRGPKATVTKSSVATNASNLLIIIAELWAGSAT
jgi:hypothetical protein